MTEDPAWAAGAAATGFGAAAELGTDGAGGAAWGGADLPSAEARGPLEKSRANASPAAKVDVKATRSGLMDGSSPSSCFSLLPMRGDDSASDARPAPPRRPCYHSAILKTGRSTPWQPRRRNRAKFSSLARDRW